MRTGRLLVGADVAIAVWRATPGEGWLASLLGNPVLLPVTRFVYDRFADLLYAWNRRKAAGRPPGLTPARRNGLLGI